MWRSVHGRGACRNPSVGERAVRLGERLPHRRTRCQLLPVSTLTHVPLAPAAPASGLTRPSVAVLGCALALLGNALAYHHAGYRPWGHAVGAACANVVHMLLVGAAAWWTARRTPAPPVGSPWRTAVLRHAAVAAAAAGAVVALGAAVMGMSHHSSAAAGAAHRPVHPPVDVWASVSWFLFWYGAVAAGTYALAAHARLRAQERAATQAQIVALRAQLNPHFLFNTLHSVAGLAREDPGAVEDVLERLGALLRYVLRAATGGAGGLATRAAAATTWAHDRIPAEAHNTRARDTQARATQAPVADAEPDLVTVADELAFVRDYLAIEQLRLGPRLRVAEGVDDAVLDRRLPPLLLQPLVENAVRHAVAPRRAGAMVTIQGWRDGARCVLEVADDGPGMSPTRTTRPSGVGLAAVRGQLAAHYGPAAALTVHTAPDAGFRVRVEFPAWPDRPAGAPPIVATHGVAGSPASAAERPARGLA